MAIDYTALGAWGTVGGTIVTLAGIIVAAILQRKKSLNSDGPPDPSGPTKPRKTRKIETSVTEKVSRDGTRTRTIKRTVTETIDDLLGALIVGWRSLTGEAPTPVPVSKTSAVRRIVAGTSATACVKVALRTVLGGSIHGDRAGKAPARAGFATDRLLAAAAAHDDTSNPIVGCIAPFRRGSKARAGALLVWMVRGLNGLVDKILTAVTPNPAQLRRVLATVALAGPLFAAPVDAQSEAALNAGGGTGTGVGDVLLFDALVLPEAKGGDVVVVDDQGMRVATIKALDTADGNTAS